MNSLPRTKVALSGLSAHRHGEHCGHHAFRLPLPERAEGDHAPSSGCCESHGLGDSRLQYRLLCVMGGAACLILGAVLKWFTTQAQEMAAIWAMVGAVLASMPLGLDVWRGLRADRKDNTGFYMNQFVTLAVLACFATGRYFTAGIIASVLLIGHMLEDRSMMGANEAIDRLLRLARTTARRLRDGGEEVVDAESLIPGERVRIRPGDTIPADGLVVAGFSMIDQASITGESLPAEAGVGRAVFAGTINLTGVLEVEVTKIGSQTVLGRVKDIVEEARRTRAPIMRITEEYARYYLPLILLIAGFTLFFTRDPQRAISVVVVSIPCTFVLAGPTAMIAALSAASRMGILVRSVRSFEAANDVDAIVIDKTGTLTTGELKMVGIRCGSGFAEERLLSLAAAVEQHSSHPIARAVIAAAKERQIAFSPVDDLQEIHGFGLLGCVDGAFIVIGRAKWLEKQGIVGPDVPAEFDHLSALHVACNRVYTGTLFFGDTIRAEAREVVARLRLRGTDEVVMLTGDRHAVAERVASEVGIDDFVADCLPEQKQSVVARMQKEGKDVLVVGDGVNDAPALASGSLSVAMGALGSDVAIQTADVALMSNDLSRVPAFLELSDLTLRIINQNMICGFIFIGVAVVLSGVGLIPPIAAAFFHELGAFFVIFNSARLLRFGRKLES